MELGFLICTTLISIGAFFLVLSVGSLARRRMTEPICLMWGFISIMLIVGGTFLHPTEIENYISPIGALLLLNVVVCVLVGAYFISVQVSILTRKCNELAMQVSLLNQENEYFLKLVKKYEEENNICD